MIKKVYFENFKGFREAELSIENFTTLIGTNASGKTNAIEGMMILSEIMTGRELSVILDGSKNIEANVRGGAKGCCRFGSDYFKLGCTVKYDETTDLEYRIKVQVEERISVVEETLDKIKNGNRMPVVYTDMIWPKKDKIAAVGVNEAGRKFVNISCVSNAAVISQIVTKLSGERIENERIPGIAEIAAYIEYVVISFKNILFLNPDTSAMRSYSRINDYEMKVNASNLSAVLFKICDDAQAKERLLSIIKKLPENEITDISFARGPLSDVIFFLDETYGKSVEKIDAMRLSDGTLRCLAVIAAVLSEKTGGMIVIEEVDNGIHPGRAQMLLQMISAIAEERKIDILITTHNAALLNAFGKKDLSGVEIVYRDKEDGSGKFVSLIHIKKMPLLLAEGKLGDVYTSDAILRYIKEEPEKKQDYSWLGI